MTASVMASRTRSIRAIGTAGRVLLGAGLILVSIWGPAWWGNGLQWHDALLGLAVFPAAMLAFQWVRLQYTNEQLQATGGIAFCLNLAVGAVLFSADFTRGAAALFFGTSLLLAALRGYAGCEVLAISNWLLRRDDQVGCVVFSPIDAVEAQLTCGSVSS